MCQNTPHAFIISLPEDAHRRERLMTQLDNIKMPHTIINGVDGRKFDVTTHPNYDRKKRLRYFGRDLLGTELGCLLSHKKALETFLETGNPHCIIFEDDAIISDNFLESIKIITEGNDIPALVRFIDRSKVFKAKHKVLKELGGGINLVRTQATPGGAYAYFITRNGAHNILQHLEKIYMPVDVIMGYSWMTGVDNLITIPSPVSHANIDDTNIGDDRFDKTIIVSGISKMTYPITRGMFKINETLMKRITFMRSNF